VTIDSVLSPEEYVPRCASPFASEVGIALVGCGEVATQAHLPAYAMYGYRVLAACDQVWARAQAAADRFDIALATTDLDEVLADPDIQVIDLAVHPHQRAALIRRIAAAGKHVFSQKPLAWTIAEARGIVELCERAGVVLMVNQQARWAPCHRALKTLIDQGRLGHVYSLLHVYRDCQEFPGSWFVKTPFATLLDHGVHYFDLVRYLTGQNPVTVKAGTCMVPGQLAETPMIHTVVAEFGAASGLVVTLHFNNIVRARGSHKYEWYVDGTLGSARVSPLELTVHSVDGSAEGDVVAIAGSWYVDAFAAAMAAMLDTVAGGAPPATSGRDHLDSLEFALDAVRSAKDGVAIPFGSVGKAVTDA
jgi:predicted dehydrogenase